MTDEELLEERNADMLLRPLKIKGVENIEIGADGESFELFLEAEDGSGVRLEISEKEREAIHNQFIVLEDTEGENH